MNVRYDMIDVSKGIDVSKTDGLRGQIIYHYWYLREIKFDFRQRNVLTAII